MSASLSGTSVRTARAGDLFSFLRFMAWSCPITLACRAGCNSTVRWTDGEAGRRARRAGGTGRGGPGGPMGSAGYSPPPRRTLAQSWAARPWGESSASSRAALLLDRCPHSGAVTGAAALCGRAAAGIGAPHCSH
eukprot:352817-Chlamydomonas_euryale.AAC.2